eukprot:CAMPEP_0119557412 /NCGR_PEP_ID=MMETSP1352-20130426/9093_1 /TAXON_ID=265584 /ORGANISM="Stauroneis constricta, Strain CCMP1120" /LENGTH=72 /DNA_ID=CAMNT_0007604515 /DNA_START=85 /DNA_END=300 /DNA_ORIENTATION=+
MANMMTLNHTRSASAANNGSSDSSSNSAAAATCAKTGTSIADPACRSKQNKVMFPWLLHEVLNDAASNHHEH